ncbi:MAG TPA: signal peptidase II [Gammaproteobacteria bacterium]|nr:signal peptidase II [Gammaproteobacteria bacterium]
MSTVQARFGKLPWLGLSVLVLAADQVSKAAISAHLGLYDSVSVLPVFNLVLLHNPGAAFSFLAGQPGWQRWFFTVLALVITAGIVLWLWRLRDAGRRWLACALALVAGGALGNVVDRIRFGYVVDFIQVHYQHWYYPAFNVADSAITVGAIMLLLDGFLRQHRAAGVK